MITSDTLLLTGIGAVTSALTVVCKVLWARSEKCEQVRDEQGKEIKAMSKEIGQATALVKIYTSCGAMDCPFRVRITSRPAPADPAG